ncbi:MAG: hypothetical protein GX808_10480 [Syntrophomonadaceae bacterium]|jgi:hypothetical protein|nr:hypothetical protein [Syntrophomonadaceae bacterium]
MLDLDFAFFNLINETKRGLVYKKVFLDRLAPFIFAPRLERLIKIKYISACGGNILLPLGVDNLNILPKEKQILMAQKTEDLLKQYQLDNLAVDRRLKNCLPHIFPERELIFGENFIKALAHVLIKEYISRHEVCRIIVVGTIEDFNYFIESLEQYQIPVTIQTTHPHRDEIFARQLLYEKGQAVSTSYLAPENWEPGDLVIIFDDNIRLIDKKRITVLFLNNYSDNLAPELESELAEHNLAPELFNLAPILESCLREKAGILGTDEEPVSDFFDLEEIGHQWGLWDHFLDKVL